MAAEDGEYRGYRIDIRRHGSGLQATIYAPGRQQPILGPQSDDPNELLEQAKRLIAALSLALGRLRDPLADALAAAFFFAKHGFLLARRLAQALLQHRHIDHVRALWLLRLAGIDAFALEPGVDHCSQPGLVFVLEVHPRRTGLTGALQAGWRVAPSPDRS
jgi:hypothetical protein